eukprot:TRINITY_DN19183_c0_g5_i3.p1 TRINITY_DN19183_c0_g5~~TRINITY_DN19183_c0_g5_i3.p1  ORF type:complete len:986 (-),score=68.13 TRINITY_DN19183_c0_g5_i3:86-3043(-)
MEARGLSLEYYASYNVSWFEAWKYFNASGPTTVDISKLQDCKDTTNLMDDNHWKNYVKYTGDTDGVSIDSEGRHSALCQNQKFFYAPACRGQPDTCILLFSAGPGWGLSALTQKAAKFNMPLAFAMAKDWTLYLDLPRQYSSLIYWWTPDTSFVDLNPSRVIFPDYDFGSWRRGDKTTAAQNIFLGKWIHQQFEKSAPRLFAFATAFTLDNAQIVRMLADRKRSNDSFESIACRWLKDNSDVWKDWIPDERSCASGSGLVDENGSFVEVRIHASGCRPCMPGTHSEKDGFETHVCQACAPGSSQSEPLQSSCVPCEPGKYSSGWKQKECTLCPQGKFQSSTNMSSCISCPATMTTALLGAAAQSACVCPEGMYRSRSIENASITTPVCQKCKTGLSCPRGSDEANIPTSPSEVTSKAGLPYPFPKEGFYTRFADPMSAFKCKHAPACPGRESEMCATNFEGVACGKCLDGYIFDNNRCSKCTDVEKLSIFFPTLSLVVGPLYVYALHASTQDPVEMWGRTGNSIQAAFYLLLVYVQILASIQACYIDVPFAFSSSLGWTSKTYDLVSLLRTECAVTQNFVTSFSIKLFVPLYVMMIFGLTYLSSKIIGAWKSWLRLDGDVVFNNYMATFYTLFVGIAAQTISLWQCYEHPNGQASLMSSPNIICYEETWKSLVVVSIIASLIFCVGALCLFTYVIIIAPRSFHVETFRKRWKFLFIKFRPDVFWWGVVMLLKGVWLPCSTVLFTKGSRQIAWIAFLVITYQVGCFGFLPWRSLIVAVLDVAMHACLLFLLAFVPYFRDPDDIFSESELGMTSVITAVLPLLFSALAIIYLLSQRCNLQRQQQHDVVVELCAVFRNVTDAESISSIWFTIPEADRRILFQARNIIATEFLGQLKSYPLWSSRLSVSQFHHCSSGIERLAVKSQLVARASAVEEAKNIPSAPASDFETTIVVCNDSPFEGSEEPDKEGQRSPFHVQSVKKARCIVSL